MFSCTEESWCTLAQKRDWEHQSARITEQGASGRRNSTLWRHLESRERFVLIVLPGRNIRSSEESQVWGKNKNKEWHSDKYRMILSSTLWLTVEYALNSEIRRKEVSLFPSHFTIYILNKSPTQSPNSNNVKRCPVSWMVGFVWPTKFTGQGLCATLTHFRYQLQFSFVTELRLIQALDHFVPTGKTV